MDFLWLLSSIRNPVLDTIMLAFSYIGTPFVIAGIIGWIYLNNDKKEAYGISLSFILSCLLCQGVKVLARVPRPVACTQLPPLYRYKSGGTVS